ADERDLFAWAVEAAGRMEPEALLLENVRGLNDARFAGYRKPESTVLPLSGTTPSGNCWRAGISASASFAPGWCSSRCGLNTSNTSHGPNGPRKPELSAASFTT